MPSVQGLDAQRRVLTGLGERVGDRGEVVGHPGRRVVAGRVEFGGGDIGERGAYPFDVGGGESFGAQQQPGQRLPAGRQRVAAAARGGSGLFGGAHRGFGQGQVKLRQRVGQPRGGRSAPPLDRHLVSAHPANIPQHR